MIGYKLKSIIITSHPSLKESRTNQTMISYKLKSIIIASRPSLRVTYESDV